MSVLNKNYTRKPESPTRDSKA